MLQYNSIYINNRKKTSIDAEAFAENKYQVFTNIFPDKKTMQNGKFMYWTGLDKQNIRSGVFKFLNQNLLLYSHHSLITIPFPDFTVLNYNFYVNSFISRQNSRS